MKQVAAMPEEGQFVVVWQNKHGVWSETLEWEGSTLYVYKDEDDWTSVVTPWWATEQTLDLTYFVKD